LLLAVLVPVFCFSLAAVPAQATAPSGCHHSAPQPATPPSHQKCCVPSPATKALLSARYAPPVPSIADRTPVADLVSLPIDNTFITETDIPVAPPGLRVLRI
jgi:hypothetical protein